MKTKRKGKFMVLHSNNDYTCRAPTHEVLTAMTDLSSGAFKLLMYYYSKSSGWDFTEEGIAATLGTSTRTVGLLRKELVDKNYFWQEKGNPTTIYYVGRKVVMEWRYTDEN